MGSSNSFDLFRQVQDLERQLAYTRHQLALLRSATCDDVMENSGNHQFPQPPRSGSHRDKRQKSGFAQDFTDTRRNLRKYGRGLLNLPPWSAYSTVVLPPLLSPPELPPKQTADELLRSYFSGIHVTLPILHWGSFIQDYESVYLEGSFRRVTQIWCSIFFAVISLGSLSHSPPKGHHYLAVAKTLLDLSTNSFSLDHARCALLISAYLSETNLKSTGWVWLGIAIRISQDLRLCFVTGNRAASEQEMLRRLWWSIYTYDRYVMSPPASRS